MLPFERSSAFPRRWALAYNPGTANTPSTLLARPECVPSSPTAKHHFDAIVHANPMKACCTLNVRKWSSMKKQATAAAERTNGPGNCEKVGIGVRLLGQGRQQASTGAGNVHAQSKEAPRVGTVAARATAANSIDFLPVSSIVSSAVPVCDRLGRRPCRDVAAGHLAGRSAMLGPW
jgi:hypothetical protein